MSEREVQFKDGFSWLEKLLMRGGLVAAVGIGAFAIYRSNPWAAVGYLVFVGLGGLVVMCDALCVYCPYPYKHADCLFFPYQVVTWVTTMRTTPISWFRKGLSALAFLGIVAIPQHWLWDQWSLFCAFWALAAVGGIAMPLHFCRHCRHGRCPMNLVTLQCKGQQ